MNSTEVKILMQLQQKIRFARKDRLLRPFTQIGLNHLNKFYKLAAVEEYTPKSMNF